MFNWRKMKIIMAGGILWLAVIVLWVLFPQITDSKLGLQIDPNTRVQTYCYDSDYGINYYVGGTTVSVWYSEVDACKNRTTINEYYCSGDAIKKIQFDCELGCNPSLTKAKCNTVYGYGYGYNTWTYGYGYGYKTMDKDGKPYLYLTDLLEKVSVATYNKIIKMFGVEVYMGALKNDPRYTK